MKKSLFLAVLVLISAGCFAQKNPLVKKAKNYAMSSENPDFSAARAAIKEAIDAEPTKETYYWAGMIGYAEVTRAHEDQFNGKGLDRGKAGYAADESLNYWIKADELAMIPTLNKKGVEVVDTKTRNQIAKKVLEYYKNGDFIEYGQYMYEQKDYEGAYRAYKRHTDIPNLAMMQDEKLQKQMPRDTIYMKCQYNAALFAIQAEMHEEAIELLVQLKDGDLDPIAINQFLFQEYVAVKDTAKFVETLQNAILRFPHEEWFIVNLVSYAVEAQKEADAVQFFTNLIERNPNEESYYVKRGILYEMLERFDEAMTDFDKALELNPVSDDAFAGKGRVYFNKAVKLNEAAEDIMDNREYKKALDAMNEVFRQAIPYFERAHELNPTRISYIDTLKRLYFRFEMTDKYNEMEAKLEALQNQ